MSKKKKRDNAESLRFESDTEQVNVKEDVVSIEEVPEIPLETSKDPFVLTLFRDAEKRLVVEYRDKEGKLKRRIAGTEDAFPEVMRQLGLEIVSDKLV